MSIEEKWKQKLEKAITGEQAAEIIQGLAKPEKLYRLELLYDEEKQEIRLRADKGGLEVLLDILHGLASDKAHIGQHEHLFDGHTLTKGELHLIIERVAESYTGTDMKP